MSRRLQIAIAVMLIVIVAAGLISPAVDLEPTALRAAIGAAALFASSHRMRRSRVMAHHS
jgi:hypothetical protein